MRTDLLMKMLNDPATYKKFQGLLSERSSERSSEQQMPRQQYNTLPINPTIQKVGGIMEGTTGAASQPGGFDPSEKAEDVAEAGFGAKKPKPGKSNWSKVEKGHFKKKGFYENEPGALVELKYKTDYITDIVYVKDGREWVPLEDTTYEKLGGYYY